MLLLINSQCWKRQNRASLYLLSETVILIIHIHCCWSSPPLAKSFHFTPDQWRDQTLHRCQAKLLSVLRYASSHGWLFLRGYVQAVLGITVRSLLVETGSHPNCHSRVRDVSHFLLCVVADFCRKWFGLFHS